VGLSRCVASRGVECDRWDSQNALLVHWHVTGASNGWVWAGAPRGADALVALRRAVFGARVTNGRPPCRWACCHDGQLSHPDVRRGLPESLTAIPVGPAHRRRCQRGCRVAGDQIPAAGRAAHRPNGARCELGRRYYAGNIYSRLSGRYTNFVEMPSFYTWLYRIAVNTAKKFSARAQTGYNHSRQRFCTQR